MKRLVVLGGGESGTGAAILGKDKGFDVFLSDFGKIAQKYTDQLDAEGLDWEEGQHTEEKILNADLVVKSPGIPPTAPIVKAIVEKGIPVISEIEFGGYFTESKMVCITGSNGKTTTTSMITNIMLEAGKDPTVTVGGILDSIGGQVRVGGDGLFVAEACY